jgi:formate C-acetyltransferase
VNRLIARKQEEKAALDREHSTDEIIRDREELAEQIRALKELTKMAAAYGFDISGPARTAKEAVQWLYLGYLAGVKEQNGAAMSLGRTSTPRCHFEGSAQNPDGEQAQIIDDFVIKLRIIRFLRTPATGSFAGDPTCHQIIGGMATTGHAEDQLPLLPDPTTWSSAGAEPHHLHSPRLLTARRVQVAIDTSALQFERLRSCAAPGVTGDCHKGRR